MAESYKPAIENNVDTDDDNSESSSSKKKKKSLALGGLTAEKTVETPLLKETGKTESLWDRITETKTEKASEEKTEAKSEDKPEEKVPLEKLSSGESQQVVQQYAEARLEAVEQELVAAEGADKAEAAANAVLLENLQEEIRTNPNADVDEVIQHAEEITIEHIDDAEGAVENEAKESEEVSPEEEAGEAPVHAAEDADEDAEPVPAAAGSGGGAIPPAPPAAAASAAAPFYGGSGGGHGGVPLPASVPLSYNRSMNTAAAMPRTGERTAADERLALAQGLLVGGVVGYLIGKRRGRIKTEKRLAPIQKKLEKQVTDLHNTVAEKEQSVRKLAGEKAAAIRESDTRQRFAEHLQARASSAQAERVERPATLHAVQAEQLGRVVVEAPLSAAVLRPVRAPERPAVNFNKQVEAYSQEELKQAAEKVKVDNTSLRELYDAGRLDERAVRRVMTEFIEGGNVRTAISRELLQKEELRFERDPKMKYDAAGQTSGGGGAASPVAAIAGALVVQGSDVATGRKNPKNDKSDSKDAQNDKPASNRKEEVAQTAFVSFLIIVFFTILILLAL